MAEPKQFIVNFDISDEDFIKSGFKKYGDHFEISKVLYNNYIKLTLTIYKSDKFMRINVYDMNDFSAYPPFYDPYVRHDNLIYDKVCQRYNKFMNFLVKQGILKHKKIRRRHKNDR